MKVSYEIYSKKLQWQNTFCRSLYAEENLRRWTNMSTYCIYVQLHLCIHWVTDDRFRTWIYVCTEGKSMSFVHRTEEDNKTNVCNKFYLRYVIGESRRACCLLTVREYKRSVLAEETYKSAFVAPPYSVSK